MELVEGKNIKILAIDPGPEQSAFIILDGSRILNMGKEENGMVMDWVESGDYDVCVIEDVACMGMAVGKEVFETCKWIGRFSWCASPDGNAVLVLRRQIKIHFCNSMKAKDANIRQAIIDRFGGKDKAIGNKKAPGPLYGVSGDIWSALAIALYYQDKNTEGFK